METQMERKPVLINNWAVVYGEVTPYTAPEAIPRYLTGDVVGHPRLGDMECIKTTRIMDVDKVNRLIHTKNTIYVLGQALPDYEKQFPNAIGRMFGDIKESVDG